jgi:prepilin-type N-terminal cleavage/methylation domain-containing protein
MTRPRGFTLVEMLVVVTVGGVLMSLAVTSLVMLLRLEGAARERGRATDALANLARQFRADVHEARSAAARDRVPSGEARALALGLPDGRTVVYEAAAGRVIRREEGGPAAPREDWFPLPAPCRAVLDLRPGNGAEMAELMIDSPAPAGLSLRIEAAVARDHRLAGPREKAKE